MNPINKIAIFCGSSTGINPVYRKACLELARLLSLHKTGLVYGGGNIGLMGVLADEMLRLGGEVVGVIPQKLVDIEVAHPGLTEMHIVHTMHERKALMMKLADAFIILPGGIGTLDEFFDILTWRQLGYHSKPIGILNINNYYVQLIQLFDNLINQGFVHPSVIKSIIISDSPDELIMKLLDSKQPT